MANDMTGINDIYNNGLNDLYGEMPSGQNLLPKTGQTTSYNSGDDGDLEAGLPDADRFEDVSGGLVVIDHHTGLMWPRNWVTLSINGAFRPWEDFFPLIDALSFAGYDDWRMPNVQEFASIIDHSKSGGDGPSYGLYSNFTLLNALYWTSTTVARLTANAFYYNRTNSELINKIKTTNYHSTVCRNI